MRVLEIVDDGLRDGARDSGAGDRVKTHAKGSTHSLFFLLLCGYSFNPEGSTWLALDRDSSLKAPPSPFRVRVTS